MAEEDLRPLLRFGPPSSFSRKTRDYRCPPPPGRDDKKHSEALRAGANRVLEHFRQAEKLFPRLATEVPVVRIALPPQQFLSDADLKNLGLIPVLRRRTSVIAALGQDRGLTKFSTKVKSYESGHKPILPLLRIEQISAWSASDRKGPRLASKLVQAEEDIVVDVLFLPAPDGNVNPRSLIALNEFSKAAGATILDSVIRTRFVSARVKFKGQTLENFLTYRDDVAEVELPPYTRALAKQSIELGIDQLGQIPAPPATAPIICVVDSGIREGHPLLQPALIPTKSRSFPPTIGPPSPAAGAAKAGHGTEVAGVACYGDVRRRLDARDFTPSVRLINARMLDDNRELDPTRQPFVRDIADHVKPECRILNLSLGLEFQADRLTTYGAELDEIVRTFGILPIVSAGNRIVSDLGTPRRADYPEWMEREENRVCAPGESLNSLTVGGIAPMEDPQAMKGDEERVAPPGAPSPFARAGSLKGLVKPEVVEVAGNLVFDTQLKQIMLNIPTAGVLTTSPEFASTGSLLTHGLGTSLAAPKTSNLAAAVLTKYPEGSVNLVRALIIGSARHPAAIEDWPMKRKLRLCGFGVPSEARALYCSKSLATLYHEGTIRPNDVQIFEIPVPREFSAAKGKKRIWLTVAYDPPTSLFDELNIAGIRIRTYLARGDRTEDQVRQAVAKAEAAEETPEGAPEPTGEEKKGRTVFWTGTYPYRAQAAGSIYKNVFEWTRGTYPEPYRLALVARAVRPAHQAEVQSFALVVGLEADDPGVNVYTCVKARVDAIRARVRIGGG